MMKTVALSFVAVATLGLAACGTQETADAGNMMENATASADMAADNAMNAAGAMMDNAANAMDNAANTVENAM